MAKLVALGGPTGTGKSTSIKYLDPKATYIINVAGKELPFKGSSKLYNAENKNHAVIETANEVLEKMQKISQNAPQIKVIIIEDANYLMGFNMVRKATETGYTKFSVMAKDMTNLILEAKKLRDDLIIFYFSHLDDVTDEDKIIGYKLKTAGKLIDSQITLEGLFTVCLYTNVEETKNGMEFSFLTNRKGKVPAKSPDGMFSDIKIDNNLQIVVDAINEYYK